jgi:hypothetical protein
MPVGSGSRTIAAMSATPDFHTTPSSEPSGEQLFFVLAIAFIVLVATIVLGFFLPIGAGVALIFGVLGVVLALIGAYLSRLLSDG